MENYEKAILKDVYKTISLMKKNKSSSIFPYLYFDLDQLYEICSETGVENVPIYDIIDGTKIENFYKKYVYPMDEYTLYYNVEFVKKLVNSIIDFFEGYPRYKLYRDTPKKYIDFDRCIEICVDFLDEYNQEYLDILYEIFNNRKLLTPQDGNYVSEYYGVSYSGYLSYDSYILFANSNSIITAITLAHELSHVYSSKLTDNYPLNQSLNKFLSPTLEIRPFTTEMYFKEYIIRNKICPDDIKQIHGEFISCIYDQSLYIADLFDQHENNYKKVVYDDNYKQHILYIIGRTMALYLYSLNDKEKVNSILYKIDTECCNKQFIDILKDCNIDIEDIMNFDSPSKLILKQEVD